MNNGDAEDRQNEDECTGGVPDVAPALVVLVGTGLGVTREIRQECPREQASNKLADTCRRNRDQLLCL